MHLSGGRGRYGRPVPILRDDDERLGCLALPMAGLAGLVVVALFAAAVGLGAGAASIAGVVGAAVAAAVARWLLPDQRGPED